MNKLFMLALANIRKNKGQAVSLVLLTLLAAMLLNMGLLIYFDFGNFFDRRAEALNSPSLIISMQASNFTQEKKEFLAEYEGVTATEQEKILMMPGAEFTFGSGKKVIMVIARSETNQQAMSPLTFIGEQNPPNEKSIYVPYQLKLAGDYQLGDDFLLEFQGQKYTFTIDGFTEDILLGTVNASSIGFVLPEKSFNSFSNALNGSADGVLLAAQIDDSEKAPMLISEFKKEFNIETGSMLHSSLFAVELESVKMNRTLTGGVGAMIIVGFAVIITMVSVVVIRFKIGDAIEENTANIGTLKACGYKSNQIITSFLLQFGLISLIGSLLGILCSYGVLPVISYMFAVQMGLVWEIGFSWMVTIGAILFVLTCVVLVSWGTAAKINKLHPIVALRGGIVTHSFKKNWFPLEKTRGNINFLLACKKIVQSIRQNILITLIVTFITFACVFALVMFYNIAGQSTAFIKLVGGEVPDMAAIRSEKIDSESLLENVLTYQEVRKAFYFDTVQVNIFDQAAIVNVSDFTLTENEMIYDGRFPKHDNEISVNGMIADKFGTGIGDNIVVSMGDKEAEFLITGLLQSSNSNGMDMSVTLEGVRRLNPNFEPGLLYFYLHQPDNIKDFIEDLKQAEGDNIFSYIEMSEMVESTMGTFIPVVSGFVAAILFVTALVVMLILYLVLKSTILRQRREIGIQKAMGYTTFQLMQQLSLATIPGVALGAALGVILALGSLNPAISVLFYSIGIMRANFDIPLYLMALLALGIIVFACIISNLITLKIRRITPYSLIEFS